MKIHQKSVIVLLALVALQSRRGLGVPIAGSDSTITNQTNDYGTSDFNWSYTLSDGSSIQQTATAKKLDDGRVILVLRGSYSYVTPDGVRHEVSYESDENGYRPQVSENPIQLVVPHFVGIDPKVLASLVG
ncbi:endocuticle structural glycoprotein ABD-5-like [Uranotaenia lowii]|uniref:endocuticle structural glycoprotein ABD-5-like n=1 Tax=Uranotaenia lowii TaxID=190385 RepID=UPI00247A54F3|nr:endocuticle structural glycoprotein ABD-5-like [Uranotaenia lowii]